MNNAPTIVISYGNAKTVKIDLSAADMTRGAVVLSIRKAGSTKIIQQETYTAAQEYYFTFDDDFVKAHNGVTKYEYDLMQMVNGERFALTNIGTINVVDSVGGHTNAV